MAAALSRPGSGSVRRRPGFARATAVLVAVCLSMCLESPRNRTQRQRSASGFEQARTHPEIPETPVCECRNSVDCPCTVPFLGPGTRPSLSMMLCRLVPYSMWRWPAAIPSPFARAASSCLPQPRADSAVTICATLPSRPHDYLSGFSPSSVSWFRIDSG